MGQIGKRQRDSPDWFIAWIKGERIGKQNFKIKNKRDEAFDKAQLAEATFKRCSKHGHG